MHVSKAKVIFNNYAKKEIKLGNKEIEIADKYIYVGAGWQEQKKE